jgi:hypothetical protein
MGAPVLRLDSESDHCSRDMANEKASWDQEVRKGTFGTRAKHVEYEVQYRHSNQAARWLPACCFPA